MERSAGDGEMSDDLSEAEVAVVAYLSRYVLHPDSRVTRSELVSALGEEGFLPHEINAAVARLQTLGRIVQGPVVNSDDDPWYRVDKRIKHWSG